MANVFVEGVRMVKRKKVTDYVVEEHVDKVLHMTKHSAKRSIGLSKTVTRRMSRGSGT